MPDDQRVNRRRFFTHGLRQLLKPLTESIESSVRELAKFESAPELQSEAQSQWLRPPGALPTQKFLETCSRCAACVRVCPVQCIKIDASGEKGNGAPFIEADLKACAVCDGLYCMPACPTGALVPTPLARIDMGTAVWNPEQCLRTDAQDCTICIDHCPIGSFALELINNDVVVHENGCIGCGVCQQDCPTNPKAIVVQAKSER